MKHIIILSMLLSNFAQAQLGSGFIWVKADTFKSKNASSTVILTTFKNTGGELKMNGTDIKLTDFRGTPRGLDFNADYSANYTDLSATNKGYVVSLVSAAAPPGLVIPYAGTSAPSGYLLCDGSAVSRTTYAALFAVISTTYGVGDGSTTFNIPDLRQRFPLGKSAAGTGSTLGGTGGTIDHLHTVDPPNTTSGAPSSTVAATNLTGTAASTTHTHDVNIAQFNSGTGNPPFIALNYIIKQ